MVQIEEDVREKVKSLLRELFQFDNQDLDFGIYRIMNFKRKEIEKFIERDLIAEAEKQFKEYTQTGQVTLRSEVEKLKSEIIRDFGVGTIDEQGYVKKNEDAPKVKEYLRKVAELKSSEASEAQMNDVFNQVYEFFSRYYDKGDFLSKRRYGGKEKYYVPYNGEEVILYWANSNQHYVKNSEYFKKYCFNVGSFRFSFLLAEAEIEVNNVAGENRYFMLSPSDFIDINDEKRTINIYFNFRALTIEEKAKVGSRNVQENFVADAVDRIFAELSKLPIINSLRVKVDGEKTLLEKHLNNYVRRNTADYFVHKNLKNFLEKELEFYLKNEVMDLDELKGIDEKSLRIMSAKVKAIREISKKVIEFLAQVEDFQKMLFNKKKLIVGTEYIITLDKIKQYASKGFFEDIVNTILRNDKQLDEWEKLLGVKVNSTRDLIERQTIEGIDWKKLPLDTKHFGIEFKDRLLEALSEKNSIEELLDGVLIKSENFQALNLLLKKYYERVKVVYIDPPYNTGSDEFLYKDNYQHSSWLSMMNDRLLIAQELMTPDGALFTHIDENEQFRLRILFDNVFGPTNYIAPFVWLSRAGKGGTVAKVQIGHEYVECAVKDKQHASFKPTVKEIEAGNYSDEKGMYRRELLRQWGSQAQRREDRPSMYFPIPSSYGEIYPKLPDGSDGRWRFGYKTVMKMLSEGDLDFFRDEKTGDVTVYRKIRIGGKTTSAPNNMLDDVGSSADGTKEIQALFNEKVFDTCKPLKLAERLIELVTWEDKSSVFVLDFFAGSGTTAHAVIELNRQDGNRRKFILIEMGDHFDNVVLPRIKKVAYSLDWKEGKPIEANGSGILCCYHYLEQYEDTLNNIAFAKRDKTLQEALMGLRDYFLRYMLDYETKESPARLMVDKFATPFDYKIKLLNGSTEKIVAIDLVETFNYLLGLSIEHFLTLNNENRCYKVLFGKLEKQTAVIIWRNLDQIDLEQDKEFIEKKVLKGKSFDYIFINGDSYIKNARPIEPEFKRLMGA